jgi:hypothetical protein
MPIGRVYFDLYIFLKKELPHLVFPINSDAHHRQGIF